MAKGMHKPKKLKLRQDAFDGPGGDKSAGGDKMHRPGSNKK